MGRTISVAAVVMAAITALIVMVSYAWGMGCPSTRGNEFNLQIESVTVDGVPVPEEDLSVYFSHGVAVSLRADIERSQVVEGEYSFAADHVTLRFHSLVNNYGSYDEIFRIDSGDR